MPQINAEAEIKDYEAIVNATQAKTGKVTTKHFHTIAVIGKGSYGKVLLVVKKDTGQRYALKILKKDEIIKRNQFEHTMAERRILVSFCALISFSKVSTTPSQSKWTTPFSQKTSSFSVWSIAQVVNFSFISPKQVDLSRMQRDSTPQTSCQLSSICIR